MATRTISKYVNDYGGRGEVIILLHGFLSSSRYWNKLQPFLTQAGYRVITIDLLGFGNAPKPPRAQYSYDDHVSHIHSTLQQLNIRSSFFLLGHSMGGLVAARYSRIYHHDIKKLILLHPPLYKDMAEARNTLRSTNVLYKFLLDSKLRRIGWILIRLVARYKIGDHSRLSRELSLQNLIEKAEAFTDLQSLSVPTMLVVGTKDRQEYAKNITLHTLSSTVEVALEDVSHHSPLQKPRLIKERILTFLVKKHSDK